MNTHTIDKKKKMYAIIKYMYFKKCFRHFSTIFNPLSDKRLKTLNNQSTVLMLNNTEITTSRDRDAILPRTRVAEINSPDPPRGPNSVSQAHTRFVIVKHRLPEGGGSS